MVCPVDVHADSLVYDGVLTVGDPEKVESQQVHELVGSVLSELNISLGSSEGQTPIEDSDGMCLTVWKCMRTKMWDKYLLNLSKILPVEVPRPMTNDLEIRRLRPEFLMNYHSKFDSHALTRRNEEQRDSDDDGSDVSARSNLGEQNAMKAKAEHLLSASSYFYVLIPELARVLDELLTLPVDSGTPLLLLPFIWCWVASYGYRVCFGQKLNHLAYAPDRGHCSHVQSHTQQPAS